MGTQEKGVTALSATGAALFTLERVGYAPSGGPAVLHDVTLAIPEGAFVVLQGASGSGKSTLLRLLVRLEEPTSGRILFKGTPLEEMSPARLRLRAAFVHQVPAVLPGSVADNLLAPFAFAANKGLARPTPQDIDAALARLLPEGLRPDQDAAALSVGQRQRLCLVRALLLKPAALLLDEPAASLDQDNRLRLAALLDQANRQGVTIIMAAHGEPEGASAPFLRVAVEGKCARLVR